MTSLRRRSPWLKKHARQMTKFAVSGGIGSVIDLGSLVLFVDRLAVDARIAVVLSSLLSLCFVFVANKLFTFGNRDRSVGAQIAKFLTVYGIAFVINLGVSWLLLWFGVHYFLAKVAAIGSTALWNYTLLHSFVFRKQHDDSLPLDL